MRVKSRRIEQLLIETLSEAGSLGATEFYRRVCAKLKKGESLSEPTFYRYLKDLHHEGIFEKTPDGKWRLNERGLLKFHKRVALNKSLYEQQLVHLGFADAYFSFTHDSPDTDHYLAAKFSKNLEEAAKEVIHKFYREALTAYLSSQREKLTELINAFVGDVFVGDKTLEFLNNLPEKFVHELLKEVGFAIWLGLDESEKPENVWQLVSKLSNNEEDLKQLSLYLLRGLSKVFRDDEKAHAFLRILHEVGFLPELIFLPVNGSNAEQIYSEITGPPREGETDWRHITSLIKWLMRLKAVGVIIINGEGGQELSRYRDYDCGF